MLKAALSLLILFSVFVSIKLWRGLPAPPCTEPIAYSIGSFDRRFNLSREQFLSALREAETVWERPSGRALFKYEPEEATLPINLIYDYRQEVTEDLGELETELKQDESTYRSLESAYAREKGEYEVLKDTYEARVTVFEARDAAYEARIDSWNAGPRTNKAEFESLERERLSINAEVSQLRVLENELNQKVRNLNQLVERMNRLARDLNLNVEEYNTIGAIRGETFEGGVYYSGAEGEGINIYEFESREKLVRVLAHELGHALGLEHVEDPQAIMYKLNQDAASIASEADLAALETLCASTY